MYDIFQLQLPSLTPLTPSVLIICPSCFHCCLLYLNSFRRGRPNQKAHFLQWTGTDESYSMTAVQQLWLMGPTSWQCCSNAAAVCCLCLCLPQGEIRLNVCMKCLGQKLHCWQYYWLSFWITKSLTSREWDEQVRSLSLWSLKIAPWTNISYEHSGRICEPYVSCNKRCTHVSPFQRPTPPL